MRDIINDIVETATNQSECDLSNENNLELQEGSCSDRVEEELENRNEITLSGNFLDLATKKESEDSVFDNNKPSFTLYESDESVETIAEKTGSDEFPSSNLELGRESGSDEETEEADEKSSDIDIVGKHVSRDSVSVPSVNEPFAEKLER